MEKEKFSYPVSLRRMQITDKFWKNEMELVRTEVIPYQWNALNDKVEGASPKAPNTHSFRKRSYHHPYHRHFFPHT